MKLDDARNALVRRTLEPAPPPEPELPEVTAEKAAETWKTFAIDSISIDSRRSTPVDFSVTPELFKGGDSIVEKMVVQRMSETMAAEMEAAIMDYIINPGIADSEA